MPTPYPSDTPLAALQSAWSRLAPHAPANVAATAVEVLTRLGMSERQAVMLMWETVEKLPALRRRAMN